jgi:hypothetical protein
MNDADRKAFMKEHAGAVAWLDEASQQAKATGIIDDLDPPSYLPMRAHEALRIPDLNADNWNTQRGYGLSGKTIELPVYNHKHNECRMCGLCIYCETCKCLDYGVEDGQDLQFDTCTWAPATHEVQRHKDGSVAPPNCRCAKECWTDEDDAAWRKEWREST